MFIHKYLAAMKQCIAREYTNEGGGGGGFSGDAEYH